MNVCFSRFRVYFELLRPPLAAMDLAIPAAAALLASYATNGTLPPLLPFLLATVGAYFAITSSYVYNDCCDIDVDKTGMPDRPLPSARLSKRDALAWSLLLFLLAAVVALYLNPESFAALIAATVMVSIYSAWAKRSTPFSWVLVGLSFWPGALRSLAGHGARRCIEGRLWTSSRLLDPGSHDLHHRLGVHQLRCLKGRGR